MGTQLVTGLLTVVLTSAIVAWCLRAERRAPTIEGDVVVLRYAPWMRWVMRGVGVAFLALAGFLVARAFAVDATDKDVRSAWMALGILPLSLGAFCESRVRLELDGEGVRGLTAFRGHREVAWADVESVRFSGGLAAWVLRDRHGEKIRVARYLVGSESLLKALEARVSQERWADAVAAWRRQSKR
jgi:hypothetical protein